MGDTIARRWLLLVAGGLVLGALAAATWTSRGVRGPDGVPVRLTRAGDVTSFLWSHTGPRLLLVRRRDGEDAGSRWIADIETGALRQWSEDDAGGRAALAGEFAAVDPGAYAPQVTPDRARVATVYPEGLAVVDTATGQATPLLRAGNTPSTFVDARFVYGPSWAPDGFRLALTVLEASASLPRSVRDGLRALPGPEALGQFAGTLSEGGVRTALWVVDTRTGYARRVLDCGPFDPREGLTRSRLWLQWSPDGRRLGFIRAGDVWAIPVRAR